MLRRTRFHWRRFTNPAAVVGLLVVALAVLWTTAPIWTPTVVSTEADSRDRLALPSVGERLQFRAATVLAAAWLFFFGASVGSFLNVVVWRVPRGVTLIWQPSRCPRCGAAIRPADNVPVFGWLKLRGRCRVCRTPISARYPLVELVAGAMFLGLAIPELFFRGANLPLLESPRYGRNLLLVFEAPWQLVAVYGYHCLLVSVLLSWTLIERDRQRVPTGYVAWALLVGAVAPVMAAVIARIVTGSASMHLLPRPLHPVPITPNPPHWLMEIGWPNLLAEPLAGTLAGAVVGWLLGSLARGVTHRPRTTAMLMLIGVFLGWQSVLSVAILAAGIGLVAAACCAGVAERWLAGGVLLATLSHLLFWATWDRIPGWPGSNATVGSSLTFAVSTWLIAASAGWLLDAQRQRATL